MWCVMKKYTISKNSIDNIVGCFSGTEESTQFLCDLNNLTCELYFIYMCAMREERMEVSNVHFLNQIIYITEFYRKNMDLMLELVRNCDCVEIADGDKEERRPDNDTPWI